MHQRPSQGDSKSSNNISTTSSTMPSPTGRVSIYSMRERVILNKMTRIIGKLAPDTETEVTSRLHQEIPAIRVDGHLTYCVYITLQNLIHLNAIYILLYHAIFWLDPSKSHKETVKFSRMLDQNQYEQTQFLTLSTDYYSLGRPSINVNLINKYVYLSLIGISSIELITAFLWTLRKKLPCLISRNPKLKSRLNKLLLGMIIFVYVFFILWLFIHTFLTKQLPLTVFIIIFGHLILLTILDKPNLFRQVFSTSFQQSPTSRKQYRNSTSSSSTSSIVTATLNRLSHRSSSSTQSRKMTPIINPTIVISWSRWSSVIEEKLQVHQCSTFYAQARQEADDLWPIVVRRILLNIYRTIATFLLFDFLPIQTMNSHVRSKDSQPLKFLVMIFTLSTFLTHSAFLFPVKLQTILHRIATHLGQWRQQSNIRTETINPWSAECNSYTRGSVVKFANNNQHYIAIQHVNNAAHPQWKSHSILSRLFGDATTFLTSQFLLCLILVILEIIWIIRGNYWEEILIACCIVLYSSYPIFKIVRDRIIIDFVEEHEIFQTSTTTTTTTTNSTKKKSS